MTQDVLKRVPKDFFADWPQKPVGPNPFHTTNLDLCVFCVCNDAIVQLTIILQHTPFANNLMTLQQIVCGCGSHLSIESKNLCIQALTAQMSSCCAQAPDIPVDQLFIA